MQVPNTFEGTFESNEQGKVFLEIPEIMITKLQVLKHTRFIFRYGKGSSKLTSKRFCKLIACIISYEVKEIKD